MHVQVICHFEYLLLQSVRLLSGWSLPTEESCVLSCLTMFPLDVLLSVNIV